MIKYNLTCKCGNSFESWFASSSEFDSLIKKKIIKCIYCDSSSVRKTVMAPRLTRKSNQINKKNNFEKNVKKQILDIKKYIFVICHKNKYLRRTKNVCTPKKCFG